MWWAVWDHIRDSHPVMRKCMDWFERKILDGVLHSNKKQIGCFTKYPVGSVYDYHKTRFIYKESEEKCFYQVVSKPRSAPDYQERKEAVCYYPEYIAVLDHVTIIPDTDVIIRGGVMLSDRFGYDKPQNTLLLPRTAGDNDNVVLRINRKERLKGEYINLCYAGEGNIWHMTYWMIARMRLINSCEQLKSVPLLMDEYIKTCRFAKRYLSYFNWDDHKIVYLKKDRLYDVDKVYMTSVSGVLVYPALCGLNAGGELDKWVTVYSKKFAAYARNVMKDKLLASEKKKFFIRRGDQRLINEDDAISYLRTKGFEVVQPEKYSFIEELSLFHNAECIVAAAGAALTNVLYAPKECNVICIVSKEGINEAANLASSVQDIGVKVYYCPAEAVSVNGVINIKSYRVDIKDLGGIYDHIASQR